MRNYFKLCSASFLFFSVVAQAHIKPVVTLSLGADNAQFTQTSPTIYFGPTVIDMFNVYVPTNTSNTQLLGGVFVGAQFDVTSKIAWQLGASYYQNSDFQLQGNAYQQGLSSMINSYYNYDVASTRVFAETKLLCNLKNIFHPYVDAGVGDAFNRSSNYLERPYPFNGADTYPTLVEANHTAGNFAYMAGLGVDVNLTKNLLVGLGYRYADLGKSSLSVSTSTAPNAATLQTTALTSNEYLLQITAIV
jgi:opacity protein-like surface antigen